MLWNRFQRDHSPLKFLTKRIARFLTAREGALLEEKLPSEREAFGQHSSGTNRFNNPHRYYSPAIIQFAIIEFFLAFGENRIPSLF